MINRNARLNAHRYLEIAGVDSKGLYHAPGRRPLDKLRVCSQTLIYFFSTKAYVVGTQKNRLNETVLMSTQNTC